MRRRLSLFVCAAILTCTTACGDQDETPQEPLPTVATDAQEEAESVSEDVASEEPSGGLSKEEEDAFYKLVDEGYVLKNYPDIETLDQILTDAGYEKKSESDTSITYGKGGIYINRTAFENEDVAKIVFKGKKDLYGRENNGGTSYKGADKDNTVRLIYLMEDNSKRYEDSFLYNEVILCIYTNTISYEGRMEDEMKGIVDAVNQ